MTSSLLELLVAVKKNKRLVETDHNAIIVDMEFEAGNKKPGREEIFNIKSKAGQEAFSLKQKLIRSC